MVIHMQFSLPMPQGGRDAITKNPVLREDQLPQKFLYPKTKKKSKEVSFTRFVFLSVLVSMGSLHVKWFKFILFKLTCQIIIV